MCSTHFTLSCRILLFSLPTTKNFFRCMYSEIPRESAWWVLFRLPSLEIEGHKKLAHFESGLLISRTFLTHTGSACTLLFCLYLVSCTQKMRWREHSLADTVPLFSTILQFCSEMSNNWGTGLPCLHPSWIYCTGQQHKASLFPCLFSCLSALCLQLLRHGSYLSFAHLLHYVTSPPVRWLPFFSSARLPLLGHVECAT